MLDSIIDPVLDSAAALWDQAVTLAGTAPGMIAGSLGAITLVVVLMAWLLEG